MPNSGSDNWRSTLMQGLPERLQDLFQSSAKNNLLKQVNTVLLVFNDRLYDLQRSSWAQLNTSGAAAPATELAEAAAGLLQGAEDSHGILLLLPAQEFLATTVAMPGVGPESMKAALKLQSHALLPSFNEELALAVNVHERHPGAQDVALWIVERRMNELFHAFAAQDLFLASIMPRVLAPASAFGHALLDDVDASCSTRVHYRDGVIQRWLQVNNLDLEEPILNEQWQTLSDTVAAEASAEAEPARLDLRSGEDYLALGAEITADREYSYVPAGAEERKNQLQKGKRIGALAVAAALVLLIGFVPYLWQSIHARILLSNLEEQRQLASDSRGDQSVVREFEIAWGPFIEFPRQNLSDTLLTLQEVISPGVLTALEVEEGFASLEGNSSDPQSLLERLEQNPMFTEVDFARATSNTRYFIDLRLSTVDFPAYRQRYFPDVR